VPATHSDNHSRPLTSIQHRNQLLWTGAVAILLGIVALMQATSPVSSTVALSNPDSAMTGIPVLDMPRSLSQASEPIGADSGASSDRRRVPSSEKRATRE
jgi:hypothetical protein